MTPTQEAKVCKALKALILKHGQIKLDLVARNSYGQLALNRSRILTSYGDARWAHVNHPWQTSNDIREWPMSCFMCGVSSFGKDHIDRMLKAMMEYDRMYAGCHATLYLTSVYVGKNFKKRVKLQ